MSKRSKKGFRKLESHELAEFTTLKGEESGSDSEMIEIEREDNFSRKGGGLCCCCLALYVILLTCVVVLLAMTGVYFGYNMLRISNEYRQRITSLENRVDELEKSLATAGDTSDSLMSKMTERVSGVNSSLLSLTVKLDSHSHDVERQLKTVEGNVGDLQERMTAFESHPPTIGEDEVNKIRESMAEFQSHLNNYDSQLEEAKKKAGDATLEVTKIGERVTLFERNLTSLRGGLDSLRTDHKETDSNLNLMTLQVSALKIVLQGINQTVLQELNLTRDSMNETEGKLGDLENELSAVRDDLKATSGRVVYLDSSLDDLTASVNQLHESLQELEAGTVSADVGTEPQPLPTTQPTTSSTKPTATSAPSATTTATSPPSPETVAELTVKPEEATTASQLAESESVTTQEGDSTPSPESTTGGDNPTTSENSTTQSSSSSYDVRVGDSNQDSNEQGPALTTPPPLSLSPPGTQTASESTVATEDIPSSQGQNSTSSSPSAHKPSSDNPPEEVPPTVENQDNGLEQTIMKLNDLLGQFQLLDTDDDDALEYNEFATFSGDTVTTQQIFEAIDSDKDSRITYDEILDTIHILERQTTEATEDIPVDNSENHATSPYGEDEGPPDTLTQPSEGVEPTGPPDEPTVPQGRPQTTELKQDAVSEELGAGSTAPPTSATDTNGPPPLTEGDATTDNDSELKTGDGKGRTGETGEGNEDEIDEEDVKKKEGALKTLTAIQKSFDGLDINGDGRLSNYEFSAYFPENSPVVANIFSFLDQDGDFYVRYDDLSRAIASLRQGLPPTKEEEEEEATEESPEDELADYLNGDSNF